VNMERAAGMLNGTAKELYDVVVKHVPPTSDVYSKSMQAIGRIEGVAMMLSGFKDAQKASEPPKSGPQAP